jgi:ribosomal protein S6--L-glutamate ligase
LWLFDKLRLVETLATSGLKERDINVLSLHRGGKVIPNPKATRELERGDKLLCFGKQATMRDLVPEKSRSRNRADVKALP